MRALVCSVLTMVFGATVACKLQSNHSEEKIVSKLVRGGSKGADDLTAVKKLLNKDNKTDEEWGELIEAVVKGGAKGDAVINELAGQLTTKTNSFHKLVDVLNEPAFKSDKLFKKFSQEMESITKIMDNNVVFMHKVFPKLSPVKRAELFAKLHPDVDYASLHYAYHAVKYNGGYELTIASLEKSFQNLLDRQIGAFFIGDKGKASSLEELATILESMEMLWKNSDDYSAGSELTSKLIAEANLKADSIAASIKSIGGRKGLRECCGDGFTNQINSTLNDKVGYYLWDLKFSSPAIMELSEKIKNIVPPY